MLRSCMLFWGLLLGLFTQSPLAADTRMQFVDRQGIMLEILIQDAYARMDLISEVTGRSGYLLFHADSRSLYLVDQTSGTYQVVNEATIDAQLRTMNQLAEEFRAAIDTLPESERAQWELQLRSILQQDSALQVNIIETGKRSRIEDVSCTEQEIWVGDRLRQIACLASPESLGLSRRDFGTLDELLTRLSQLSDRLLQAGGPMAFALGPRVTVRLDGIPLQVKDLQEGILTRLTFLSTDPLGEEKFRIPTGFRETGPFHHLQPFH